MKNSCVVLFSGGTDSFCTAALSCEKYEEVHLLTFFEAATKNSFIPHENIKKLQDRYPHVKISHQVISTDQIVKDLSYENYWARLRTFLFLNLATPGLSSLSWHMAAVWYCRLHQISNVHDGMTQELLHLPGHMPEIRSLFTAMYKNFGIEFSSPVINWEVPEDQRFVDKLIVDRHGFTLKPRQKIRSTGQWLFDHKLLPHPNIKGSQFDRLMQHDCYPFIVYNMMVFWIYEAFWGYEYFKTRLTEFMSVKIAIATTWIPQLKSGQDSSGIINLIAAPAKAPA